MMPGTAGWYTGLIDVGSVADMKAGTAQTQQATVFQWTNDNAKPTVQTVNVTGLVAITGGPFPTQAAAQGKASGTGTNGLPGTGVSTGSTTSTVNSAAGSIPNPFSSIEHALSAIYDALTNVKMWRSLGWLLLGIAMIIAGLAMWLGPSVLKQTPVGRIASLGR